MQIISVYPKNRTQDPWCGMKPNYITVHLFFPKQRLWNAETKLPYYITVTSDRELFRTLFTNKL